MGSYRRQTIVGLAGMCVLAFSVFASAAEPVGRLNLPDFDGVASKPTVTPPAGDSANAQQVVVPVPTSAATGFVGLGALAAMGLRKRLRGFFT